MRKKSFAIFLIVLLNMGLLGLFTFSAVGQSKLVSCSNCGYLNGEKYTFCTECGQKMIVVSFVKCPYCKADVISTAKFCTQCGKSLAISKVSCSICKNLNELNNNFCTFCGNSLKKKVQAKLPPQNIRIMQTLMTPRNISATENIPVPKKTPVTRNVSESSNTTAVRSVPAVRNAPATSNMATAENFIQPKKTPQISSRNSEEQIYKNKAVLGGDSFFKIKEYSKARDEYKILLETDASSEEIKFKLAVAYFVDSYFDNAEEIFKTLQNSSVYQVDSSIYLAMIYSSRNEKNEEINYLNKAIK